MSAALNVLSINVKSKERKIRHQTKGVVTYVEANRSKFDSGIKSSVVGFQYLSNADGTNKFDSREKMNQMLIFKRNDTWVFDSRFLEWKQDASSTNNVYQYGDQ